MRSTLSPKEFSQAIDRSESSIKRWVDSGRIQAIKTDGGHRKILINEAIRFVRSQRIHLVEPEILGFSDLRHLQGEEWVPGTESSRFYEMLIQGELEKARGYLLFLYLNGLSVAEICDNPVAIAMERVGTLWNHEKNGIGMEHRATDICINALNVFKTAFEVDPDAPVALGGAPPNDPYVLPSSAVATTLMTIGVKPINYGANTPFDVFHQAIKEHKPYLVWMSISHMKRGQNYREDIVRLAKYAAQKNAYFIIGGREQEKINLRADAINQTFFSVKSMAELTALLIGLRMNQ